MTGGECPRSGGRPRAPAAIIAALVGVLMVLSACGSSATDRAQRLADRLYPGRLSVIEAEIQPGTIGFPETWATYSVTDDPDAAVEVKPLSEDHLKRVFEESLRESAEFRALRAAFSTQQLDLVSVDRLTIGSSGFEGAISVAAPVDANTIVALHGRLDAAVEHWMALRASDTFANRAIPVSSLAIAIVDPAVVPDLPTAPDPSWPTILRLGYDQRRRAAGRAETHQIFIALDGTGHPWPAAASLRPVLSDAEQEDLEAAVRAAGAQWLSIRHPDLYPGHLVLAWSRLEADSVDRLRSYLIACPTPSGCAVATATHAVALTVNLSTLSTKDLTLVTSARRFDGGWRLPLEPQRIR